MGRSLDTRLHVLHSMFFAWGGAWVRGYRRYLQHPSQGQVFIATGTHGATAAQWERKTRVALVLSLEQLPHIEENTMSAVHVPSDESRLE